MIKTKGNQNRFLKDFGLFCLPIVFAAAYPIIAYLKGIQGFPLDDAWIHQTYARNLAQTSNWVYQAGIGSGGSTSPLWTLLLVPGHLLHKISPILYTIILTILLMSLLIWIGGKWICRAGGKKAIALFGVLILSSCWQLDWAASSGMETILYSLIIVLVFYFMYFGWINAYWWIGLLIGVAVWIRPDAITLLCPIGVLILLDKILNHESISPIGKVAIGAVFPIILYGGWNIFTAGSVFPNTFFAKQAEYAELLTIPFFSRFINVITPVLTGVVFILIPGIIYLLIAATRKKDFRPLVVFLWCIGYVVLYAVRLPVDYQHGRYLIPTITPLIILGLLGINQISEDYVNNRIIKRVISPAWMVSILLINLIFWYKGMNAYQEDVNAINRLMVDSALWIKQNTPEKSKIAVHDIGAMGYFSDREIIDLAGLINPEVIPFIRDEIRLEQYIKSEKADYLVILQDWYPKLERMGKELASFSASSGGETAKMIILQLDKIKK